MSLSFHLSDEFVDQYATRPVPWGYTDAAGNALGEITFLRTYSRKKPCVHGNIGDECPCPKAKERWHEVCRRVIEGMFTLQKDHAKANRLPWSDVKAQRTAEDAFDRLFHFKWTPPGRGLWMMGTPLVMEQRNSAALQNCAFVSTEDMTKSDPSGPFAFLMEASMLGIGVGFDTKGATKGFEVYAPKAVPSAEFVLDDTGRALPPQILTGDGLVDPADLDTQVEIHQIPDDREGWVASVVRLLDSYLKPGQTLPVWDYTLVRPAGDPIRTFGGTAAGPGPLRKLHEALRSVLDAKAGQVLTTTDILDIGNLIGVCVVSGNVRRSAELALGSIDDDAFLNAKNPDVFPERNSYDPDAPGWGWMSNNSVQVNVGDDLSKIVEGIKRNGEPGVVWMDLSRQCGRLVDPPNGKDHRATGYNPCAEQTLESYECCTLVETFLGRHDDLEDFKRTLKVAYLYAKTVTLIPTHWQRTNAIMQRNRRIGTSMSGVANFADNRGITVLRQWMDAGYDTVSYYDRVYSEWLCVRESIKTTTVKPSGTVSILAGESPGVHWAPGGEFFERRVRFSAADPMVTLFRQAGYLVEPSSESPDTTVVVAFPIHSDAKRSEKQVTLFEKAHLAATAQRHWSDNSVSVTLSFDTESEAQHIGTVLAMHEGSLKTVSFLPTGRKTFPQMPYTEIDEAAYEQGRMALFPVDLSPIYDGLGVDAIGEAYCTTDACEVQTIANTAEAAGAGVPAGV